MATRGWQVETGEAVAAEAGVIIHAKPGDRVRAGQPLFTLHTQDEGRIAGARSCLAGAATVEPDAPGHAVGAGTRPLIIDRVRFTP